MANLFNNPIILDTDITSYRTAASVSQGVRVSKLMLAVGTATAVAGSVSIVEPASSNVIYPPIAVGTQSPNTIIVNDNPNGQSVLAWPDFKVTGLTATGTKLYLWIGL